MIYVNGDDGYKWLTCDACGEPLHCIDAGDTWNDMAEIVYSHRCVKRVTG